MRIMGRRIVGFSFGVGMLSTFLLMLVPTVSDTVVKWVTDLRNTISGRKNKG